MEEVNQDKKIRYHFKCNFKGEIGWEFTLKDNELEEIDKLREEVKERILKDVVEFNKMKKVT